MMLFKSVDLVAVIVLPDFPAISCTDCANGLKARVFEVGAGDGGSGNNRYPVRVDIESGAYYSFKRARGTVR